MKNDASHVLLKGGRTATLQLSQIPKSSFFLIHVCTYTNTRTRLNRRAHTCTWSHAHTSGHTAGLSAPAHHRGFHQMFHLFFFLSLCFHFPSIYGKRQMDGEEEGRAGERGEREGGSEGEGGSVFFFLFF